MSGAEFCIIKPVWLSSPPKYYSTDVQNNIHIILPNKTSPCHRGPWGLCLYCPGWNNMLIQALFSKARIVFVIFQTKEKLVILLNFNTTQYHKNVKNCSWNLLSLFKKGITFFNNQDSVVIRSVEYNASLKNSQMMDGNSDVTKSVTNMGVSALFGFRVKNNNKLLFTPIFFITLNDCYLLNILTYLTKSGMVRQVIKA